MKRWIAGPLAAALLMGALTVGAAAAPVEDAVDLTWPPPAISSVQNFVDVPEGAYYAPAVDWAVTKGVAGGTGPGRFEPEALCTTAQVVTMLWRGVGSPEPLGANPFSDVPAGTYYEKAAVWAYEAGLVSGTTFDGQQPCSRGSIVTMLWKLAGKPGLEQDTTPWNLLLVNPWNAIPQNFSVDLTSIEGGRYEIDARCADALDRMLAACRAAGYSPLVCSAYRTQQTQEWLFDQEVSKWMALGLSRTNAEQAAAKSTAVPGTSEHQLGLAADIIDLYYTQLDEKQASRPTQKWLMEHCWEYGFILRYPDKKSDETGIIYEPWHYRYVGMEAARTIREQGMCLEEYVGQMAEYRPAVAWAQEKGVTASAAVDSFAPYSTCTRGQLVTFLYHALA